MSHTKNLIKRYQETGCEDSFNELYGMYAEKAFNFAKKQSYLHWISRQDVESEANQIFFQAVKIYDVGIGEFEPFLYLMLRRRILTIGQKEITYQHYLKRCQFYGRAEEDEKPEDRAIKKEQRQLLLELIANATIPSRQALVAFAKSYSFREAAKQLGTSDKTVKNRIEKIAAERSKLTLNDYLTA
ncbi:RNA polymerase sigma factor [Jeotgalibacillus proteolyticus]|uniref:Uncharacterized protein n=1 Tax=Jeotgalibacillus proteolyticus TaxID=2082395 RepID=A0A2S5GF50_9BACL|nr:sigma-70 family RNA polymerase sigma factor [Jeotgalibacillus proteolyticus]PPA71568.1 hypothetical protein C4B60_05770 [Jeotgalibacillus proteolyticus]